MMIRQSSVLALRVLSLGLALAGPRSVAQSIYEPYTFTTLAGGASPGNLDGKGGAARFAYPQALAADSAGNLYVADTGNNTIRKVTPDGLVTTVAGRAEFDRIGNSVGA